jgi:hypothetical protein
MNFPKLIALSFVLAFAAFAQVNTIVSTTLSSAIVQNQACFNLASVTGVNAPSFANGTAGSALFVMDPGNPLGETMQVQRVSGTQVCVLRSGRASAHVSGAVVLVATNPNWFYSSNPQGACTTASTYVTPWVNIQTGEQWLCSTVTLSWVPGWNNDLFASSTASLALTAGANTPTGPLFSTSTTNAVTGWNIPLGFNYSGGFCTVPTAAYTWTTAGNIAVAGTAVVNRLLCFTWNATASKWVPSYV